MRLSLQAFLLSTALTTGFGVAPLTLAPSAMAQEVVAGEVDVDALLKLLPPGVKASYGGKSYDALSGVTTIRDLKIADPKDEAQNYVAVQEIGLRGLDMAAFKHVFDFAAYGATPDETFRQLFGDIVVKNASFTVNGTPVGAVGEIAFGGVQMKQLQYKPPGQFGAANDEKAGVQFLGALLDSVISGEIKVSEFTVDNEGNKVSVRSMALGGINRGQFGSSSLEGFESIAAGLTSKMESAKAEGGDLSKLIPWMLKAEMPPVAPEALMYFGAASVNGLSYEMGGSVVTIASYTVDPIAFYWLVPASLKLSVNDIYYKPAANDGSGGVEGLGELGLDHLDLDLGIEWAFDGTSGGASLKELRIAESQLFDGALSIDLTGINLAQLVDPATSQAAMMGVGITGAQLFVKNNGGFDKLLAVAAREENTTPEALKQQALDQLTQFEAGVPQPDGTTQPLTDRVKGIVAAFKAFITSPGTLTVKLQPAAPITMGTGMGALFDPLSGADALGITVEATPQ